MIFYSARTEETICDESTPAPVLSYEDSVVISQTISLVSQKRLSSEETSSEAGIFLFIGFNHAI